MHTTVVTITNRKRWHLLQKTLAAAFADGADRAVIVDNAAEEDIAAHLRDTFPGQYEVVTLEKNLGSAGAYHLGLKAAIEGGAEFLLLLDDDNRIRPHGLKTLKSVYNSTFGSFGKDRFCVAGYRPEQELARLGRGNPTTPWADRFLGFHVRNVPAAFWRRRPWAPHTANTLVRPDKPFARAIAPWGGLFFHRAVIERFGLPDASFVLYCDDADFTMRITQAGGAIIIVPQAEIEDLEPSWTLGSKRATYFKRLLFRGSDDQVYYQVRNQAYLETRGAKMSWVRMVNRIILMAPMCVTAAATGKLRRFRTVHQALRDGERGILGFREPNSLPKTTCAGAK